MEVCKHSLDVFKKIGFNVTIFLIALILTGGCASETMTNPLRSVTEQLLLSTAADRALVHANLSIFAGKKVYVDTNYFDSYDPKYAEGEIRDALSRAGALLVDDAKSADIIVEGRSGGLSTDSDSSLIGVPTLDIPIPFSGTPLQIPEIAFYKIEPQRATAKIALLAYASQSREHVYSSGPLLGKSYNTYHKILFIAWLTDDIPEKKKGKKADEYQSWFPQYDLQNMPPEGSAPIITTNASPVGSHSSNTSTNASPSNTSTNNATK